MSGNACVSSSEKSSREVDWVGVWSEGGREGGGEGGREGGGGGREGGGDRGTCI